MKITLSKVEYSERMSEETSCFVAVVMLDDKPAFEAHNDGHGSMTFFDPLKKQSGDDFRAQVKRLEDYAATLPADTTHGRPLPQTADLLVDDALTEWLIRKDWQKLIRKSVVMRRGQELRTLTHKNMKPDQLTEQQRAEIARRYPDCEVLNWLPNDEGFEKYRGAQS